MLDPIGPLPREVYWRRRALAVGVILLVTALVVWGIVVLAGVLAPRASAPVPQAAPSPAAPNAAEPPPAPKAPPPPPACADQDLRIAAEPARPSFPAGEPVELRMIVTNASSHACVRNTDRMLREVVVSTENGTRFWSSNDCHVESTNEKPLLEPGKSVRNEIRWTGVASTRDASPAQCAAERDTAPAGAYVVGARLDRMVSEPAPFRITG
ncbi:MULTISPECIES: hypothetical protein [unclassified Saccharopolyspora]|uniref:hypothetical protein n=1 Tax=unclassified Saccharopolyspora TaxID=2646250 RepID=UPI001CD490BE|nr:MULTISPECIES: hypothetical protein [unclassified Saccharopolyspora]MCA1193169.1 hypothetical protein [Saccharopolyspora sp. 6V]MCA1227855.1 hypothetical protein [Saccharopolyspora sp. 6M]MCA1281978.1 hypothetical protein [Saccharopolyspora sp. 7B]